MDKVVRLGRLKDEGWNVYAKIKIEDNRLSISGVEGPLKSGHCKGGCGQINNMHKPKIKELAKGWTREMLRTFWKVWDEWHLNDMNAGCEHQKLLGWKSYDKHPCEPCPICGHEYGTKWLTVPLPQAVIDFLEWLPETDIKPAWV